MIARRDVFGNKAAGSRVTLSMPISRWQRFLAQGLMAAPGAWLTYEGIFRSPSASEVFCGSLVMGGALLLGRRGVVSQVLARGIAWAVAGPCLLGMMIALIVDHSAPPREVWAVTAVSTAALLLSRSMLHTDEARAEFAPLAGRRWLLLASNASVAAALGLATLFVEIVAGGHSHMMPSLAQWIGMPLLLASLVASAVGVARMRAWGILLGAASSVLAAAVAASSNQRPIGVMVASTAVPGLAMVGAILAARWRASSAVSDARAPMRVASEPKLRIAAAPAGVETEADLELEELEPVQARDALRA